MAHQILEEAIARTADTIIPELKRSGKEISRLRKIEYAAVKALGHPTWSGDEWYDDMQALDAALKDG